MSKRKLFVVFELHETLDIGGERMPIDNAVGFLPVFDTREEAEEFASHPHAIHVIETTEDPPEKP